MSQNSPTRYQSSSQVTRPQSGPSDLSTTTKLMLASKETSETTPPAKLTPDHHSDPTSNFKRAPPQVTPHPANHLTPPHLILMTRRFNLVMTMRSTTPVNSSKPLSTRSSEMVDTRELPHQDSPT